MKKSGLLFSLMLTGVALSSCGSSTKDNINLYSREAGSGTRECFFDGIGYGDVAKEDKWESGVTVSSVSSNSDIMSSIANDQYGIGYCSLDGISGVSGIKAINYKGVTPSESTVIDGTYDLKRNFNYVTRDYGDNPEGENKNKQDVVNAFIEFLSTSEGITTIKSKGGIVQDETPSTTWSEIKTKYSILGSETTVDIKFCGSTSVQKIGQALADKFTGVGYAENVSMSLNQTGSGDAVTGVTDGKNGVNYDIGYLSREIKDSELTSLGDGNKKGKICNDAVVVIINSANSTIDNIDDETLVKIYKGEITKWSELK